MLPKIMQGAEPQFYRGNTIGCLVVHGFMASPAEVGWLGQHLAQAGYTVYVPRLSGHGTEPAHMHRMRWQDWYTDVLSAYQLLEQQCEQVFVVGHSMGGLLGTLLAQSYPVDGLVVVASPLVVPNRYMHFARLLSLFMRFYVAETEDWLQREILSEQERRQEALTGRVNYSRWSVRAIHELNLLIDVARRALPHVYAPLLALYAEGDVPITSQSADLVMHEVASVDKSQYILRTGGHIIFQDKGRDEAINVVAEFIAQRLAAN